MHKLDATIRTVIDFPKKGVAFKDITTLLKNGSAFQQSIDIMAAHYKDTKIEKIVGMESRGFIFGSALAYKLGVGFIPVRKPGKLPAETMSEEYELEYGLDSLQIHKDAIEQGENVLIVDDLLATGGTAAATTKLVQAIGGKIVGLAFLIELTFLSGREKLQAFDIFSIIQYGSE